MQPLEIISVNLWQILISLGNLLLLFFLFKRFLYRPLQRILDARQKEIDGQYKTAEEAERSALSQKAAWEEKRRGAEAEADAIRKAADAAAKRSAAHILEEAGEKAAAIERRAEEQAALMRREAEESIRQEIVDVSSALTEKVLEREINTEDHRALIDSFLKDIGDDHE